MTDFVNKHSFKIQLSVAIAVIGFVIYWSSVSARYVYKIEDNGKRINKVEVKLDALATKQDLQILKQDIKDFIK